MTGLPDDIRYCPKWCPLHILPYNYEEFLILPPQQRESIEEKRMKRQQRRTREFFKIMVDHPEISCEWVLPWGETVGEFCIWYTDYTHRRRMQSTKRRRQKKEKKRHGGTNSDLNHDTVSYHRSKRQRKCNKQK